MCDGRPVPCLVTVTNEAFLAGTMVMLYSFLKHNRWFGGAGGEIVIIHDCLPAACRMRLEIFNNLRFQQTGEDLKDAIQRLDRELPRLEIGRKGIHLHALEMFRLPGGRISKALFCDSDILIRGDLAGLFERPEPLLACGDRSHYEGCQLDARTFQPATPRGPKPAQMLKKTFNSGWFLVDGAWLNPVRYECLCTLLDPCRWKEIQSSYTDQVVLNLHFREEVTLLGGSCNFLIQHRDLILQQEDISPETIKVLHFNGKIKPWDLAAAAGKAAAEGHYVHYLNWWLEAYRELISRLHVMQQLGRKIG